MEFRNDVTVCIPVSESSLVLLTTWFAVLNQDIPNVVRVLVADGTEKGLDKVFALREAAKHLTVEVYRRDPAFLDTDAGAQRRWLMKCVSTRWAWLVDSDVAPLPSCLRELLAVHDTSNAMMVAGVKLEMTRDNPWNSKDINPGFTIRTGKGYTLMPWGDSANLLVRPEYWLATEPWQSEGSNCNGDNVYTTAQIARKYTAVQAWGAIAWHLPETPPRWKDVDTSDKLVLDRLEKIGEFDWMRSWQLFKTKTGEDKE